MKASAGRPMTISEKILARAAGRGSVSPGEYVKAHADTIIVCDLGWSVVGPPVRELGAEIFDPDQVVVVFDHKVPADGPVAAELHRMWRAFCAEHGITKLHDIGDHGISHVISVEHGYAAPGTLQVSVDSHANTCGAMGCYATALGMDIVSDMVLGWNWYVVPESVKVRLSGSLQPGIAVRDVAQHVITELGDDLGSGRALEFVGPLVATMSLSDRMTLCNWSRKIQAVVGIINPDAAMLEYARAHSAEAFVPLWSDEDAVYLEERHFDVSDVEPLVAAPPDPTNTKTLAELSGIAIQQAFVGSCAGSSFDDLRMAAEVLSGRKIHSGVRMIVSPGSEQIWRRAEQAGLLRTLSDAGAIVTASTCGACIGGMGALGAGEVCVSTSTENFPGRMGSRSAEVYLASAFTVAASALTGKLTDARTLR